MKEEISVEKFLESLNHPQRAEIEELRKIMLAADEKISESIKWNAPSYYITDHFATFKLYPQKSIQIIFHTGAKAKKDAAEIKIDDVSKLLKWLAPSRAMTSFSNIGEINLNREALTNIVRQWIKYV